MPVITAHEVRTKRESGGPRWARASFFLILSVWNVYLLVGFADLFIVGNLVIVATGATVRHLAKRRQRSDVES